MALFQLLNAEIKALSVRGNEVNLRRVSIEEVQFSLKNSLREAMKRHID